MAEIRLISILPTPGVQQPQLTQGVTTQGASILVDLPSGSILSGFIVNRDAGGNPILRTDKGDITFASNFFLKIGSEVIIRVETRAGQNLARILSVDGQTPEVAEGRSGFAQRPEVIVPRNLAPDTASAAAVGNRRTTQAIVVEGLVISPAKLPSGDDATPEGAQVFLKVTSLTAPPTSATAQTAISSAEDIAARAATQTTAATTATPVPPIPATASPNPAGLVKGQTLTAIVIGNEPTGEALLQTPAGIVRLQPGTVLTPGSTLTLEVGRIQLPNATATEANALPAAPLASLARNWNSLQQIFTLLAGRDPQSGLLASGFEMLAGNAPWLSQQNNASPGQNAPLSQNISSGLMFFINALRGGDFRSWLGKNNAQWLDEHGHASLLKKAEGEFASIARQFTETVPGQWQTLFFPVAVAGDWQQVRLFVKRDKKESSGKPQAKEGEKTRFVIEADLSQLGEIQIDGLVRRHDGSIDFDLYIRSMQSLTQEIQQDILSIYTQTGELTGYKGNLLFQTVKEFPVNPIEEVMAQSIGGVVA